MGQSWSRWQQRRGAKTLQELAPHKTPGHEDPLPDLDRDILLTALNNVASYIKKKGGDVTVVAVGGAVNTIHLQSRSVTHDVDFYNNHLTAKDFETPLNGAREAVKKHKSLEEDWFNNRTILFMPRDQCAALTDEALLSARSYSRSLG
ncbi:Uu.00g021760.m01.CDS01 [Anthostomella pinea]|uniref:Uu.00g021760.m01.CDS01 n=1 Tax=Anthostomella pinea TaxID=933095 RepID=A0AAI8YNS9_9PEZI|nr:Uu.00g021760.m01.CDS01 [Anthostomella pinea]